MIPLLTATQQTQPAPPPPEMSEDYWLDAQASTPAWTTFGSTSASYGWRGGALAPNGKIYCAPYNASTILKIDPDNQTITEFGSFAAYGAKWCGANLAPNGKIYCVPGGRDEVLVIDPADDTYYTIAGATNSQSSIKWWGAILAGDNRLYCSPYHATDMLVIDPSDDSLSFLSVPFSAYDSAKFIGGALAPNGKVFLSPFRSDWGFLYDIATDNWDDFGYNDFFTNSGWRGCVLTPGGIAYGMDSDAYLAYEVDLVAKTGTRIGYVYAFDKYDGGVLGPNGKVYAIPQDESHVQEIDPATSSVAYLFEGELSSGSAKWSGGVLAPNGKIYCVPHKAQEVLEINCGATLNHVAPVPWQLSRYTNKY